jgi:hypothetical protein
LWCRVNRTKKREVNAMNLVRYEVIVVGEIRLATAASTAA